MVDIGNSPAGPSLVYIYIYVVWIVQRKIINNNMKNMLDNVYKFMLYSGARKSVHNENTYTDICISRH